MNPVERYSVSGLILYSNSFVSWGILLMLKLTFPELTQRVGTTSIFCSVSCRDSVEPSGERIIPSEDKSPTVHNIEKSNATAPRSERVNNMVLRKRRDAVQNMSVNIEATVSHGAMKGQRRVTSKQRAKTTDVIVPVLIVKALFQISDRTSRHFIGGSLLSSPVSL